MLKNITNKKILIIHDRFMFRGGAERLIIELANGLDADVCTGFWNEKESFSKSDIDGRVFVLGNQSQKTGWRYVKFQFLFFFRTKFIKDYDIVIFSGNNCLSASHNVRHNVIKYFYCHTPVRHAYDLKDYYLSHMAWWKRTIFRALIPVSRFVYSLGFKSMDVVIANSYNVQKRIKKYLQIDSTVVYPPINTDKFKWLGQSDYYLSFARVDKLKRVGDIAKAFKEMPEKKLIIASSGDDYDNVSRIVEDAPNISMVGWQANSELIELVGNCIATIYIPIDEDAGMTPVESMSAGKPCLGVAEGGLLETIIDQVNGKLIRPDYTIDDLIVGIEYLTPERCLEMRDNCEAQADNFSREKFLARIKNIIYAKENQNER